MQQKVEELELQILHRDTQIEQFLVKEEELMKRFEADIEQMREAQSDKDNQIIKAERMLKEKTYELSQLQQ